MEELHECGICLEALKERDAYVFDCCQQRIHSSCMEQIYRAGFEYCPFCRGNLPYRADLIINISTIFEREDENLSCKALSLMTLIVLVALMVAGSLFYSAIPKK